MRAGTTAFIEVYYAAYFLFGFFGNVSSKKTPLKEGIFNLFTASSNSKLFSGLFGKITFSIEISNSFITKCLLYLYCRSKN